MAESESCSNLKRKREESPDKTQTQIERVKETTKKRRSLKKSQGFAYTSNGNRSPGVSAARMSILSEIMEALARADIIRIGVCGVNNEEMAYIVETISRRAKRDNLFDKFVTANVTQKPNLNKIQAELAHALGITMKEKSADKRADLLRDRIKMEPKILVVLTDIRKGIDLDEVGIPFGDDHTGCKILLTSSREEILSNQMHAQRVFMA